MKILVLQHADVEDSGMFREFLNDDGHEWVTVHLNQGEALPESIDGYDALWVLGGPMDVWQEDEYPWLKAENPNGTHVPNRGSMLWRLRRAIVSFLPRNIVTKIAQMRAAVLVRKAQKLNG